MNRSILPEWLRVTAIVLVACGGARGQQPSQRERELEDLVRKLNDRVESLERRLNALDGVKPDPVADAATEARVQKLEESVEQIKQERPPAADSKEWKAFKDWFNNPMALQPYWKDALNFKSADGSIKLKIGGRIQYDWAYFDEDGVGERIPGDIDNDSEFRRARLYFSGTIFDNIDFKAQYDFASDGPAEEEFKDVYVGVKKVPYVGNLRFGQFKEPFGLEELTSSNYITFMERSLLSAFSPGRNDGIMAFDTMADDRMTWAVGVFRQNKVFDVLEGGRDYNVTARLTGLPLYEEDGRRLVHLGVAYTHQNYENDKFLLAARPESHLAPPLVTTGVFNAEYGDLVGFEAAWVNGPFSLQGEYVQAFYNGSSRANFWGNGSGDPEFCGATIQASYFLTGEHRPYKKSAGAFGRVRPTNNLGDGDGIGAWELAARYSYLDLNDHNVSGGRLDTASLGLNWYWNPNMRMMWNYVYADPSRGGNMDILQWRVQLAF